jgi:hypothetical protein
MIAKSGPAVTLGAGLLLASALGFAPRIAAAAESAPLERTLPPSNSALLLTALRGVSAKLARQAPVTPGTRIVIATEGEGPLTLDARQALVEAFTARRIEVVLGAMGSPTPAEPAPAPVDSSRAPVQSNTVVAPTTPPANPNSLNDMFGGLQRERQLQAARADSIARAQSTPPATSGTSGGATSAASSVLAKNGELPRLEMRVEEARIDYVKQYRGGILGAYRVERRANARLDLRLTAPGTDAISWTASADSSLGDVVLRSDLPSLETKTRPETVGQLPQAGFKKVLEPILVIVLVAGLVSLFYQNRP